MINLLAVRGVLLLVIGPLLLTCNRNSEKGEGSNPAGAAALTSEKAKSAYDFVNSIGVNTHLNYFDVTYGNFQLVERELTSIGIRHVRDGVHLLNADYNKAVYSRWIQLGKDGIRFDAVVDPRSALGPITSAKLDEINTLAGNTIESFEGANELDVSNLSDWASVDRNFQSNLYRSVKSMTGGAKAITVIGPSMASASNGSSVGSVSDSIDSGNLHPYPAGKMPSAVFPEQSLLAKKVSENKKFFVTESGYHNALNDHSDQPGISEEAAAKYIPRLFLENFLQGIPRTYLYEFLDESPDPGLTHFQMHWGLIRSDGSEKPAFHALKNLISELNDSVEPANLREMTYSLGNNDGQIHHLLLQKSDGQFCLVLWQEVPSYDTKSQQPITVPPQRITLTLDHSVRSVTTYEPTVQSQPLRTQANVSTVSLDVPDHPVVVEIKP